MHVLESIMEMSACRCSQACLSPDNGQLEWLISEQLRKHDAAGCGLLVVVFTILEVCLLHSQDQGERKRMNAGERREAEGKG